MEAAVEPVCRGGGWASPATAASIRLPALVPGAIRVALPHLHVPVRRAVPLSQDANRADVLVVCPQPAVATDRVPSLAN
jgi:hypothetical protein